jgi:hypothetical protein
MSNELPQGILELPGGNILSPEFVTYPFYIRLAYLYVAGIIVRARYYFAWLTAEAAFNVAGFGYDKNAKKTDGSAFFNLFPKWNTMANVDIPRLETSTSLKLMTMWNFKTQRWLVTTVYKRVLEAFPGVSRTVPVMSTYFISALWHGIYPGYYVCFMGCAFASVLLPGFYSKCPGDGNYLSLEGGIVSILGRFIKWAVTFAVLDFVVLGLLFLSWSHAYGAQQAFQFYMYPLVVVLFVVFMLVPSRKKTKVA